MKAFKLRIEQALGSGAALALLTLPACGGSAAGDSSQQLAPYPVSALGCSGPVHDAGDYGQCCAEALCYTPDDGSHCLTPEAAPEKLGKSYGSGKCLCGAEPIQGPFATNPAHEPQQAGSCCYVISSITCDGRPLLVDGAPLASGLTQRCDWAFGRLAGDLGMTTLELPTQDDWRALELRSKGLPEAARRAIVEHWTRAAQMEHASVAAFSRFSLQLLAVGAPPSLIEDAHRAALDEIKHAELCFSVATTYAGHSIGPGPLPVDERVLTGWDLQSVAVGTVEEGCVGETIAALEAEAATALAEDDAVRAVHLRIYADEARHAELAWRFVRWAAELGGAPLRAALREAFERTIARFQGAAPLATIHDQRLAAHGILSERQKQTLRVQIVNEVIRPALAELLA